MLFVFPGSFWYFTPGDALTTEQVKAKVNELKEKLPELDRLVLLCTDSQQLSDGDSTLTTVTFKASAQIADLKAFVRFFLFCKKKLLCRLGFSELTVFVVVCRKFVGAKLHSAGPKVGCVCNTCRAVEAGRGLCCCFVVVFFPLCVFCWNVCMILLQSDLLRKDNTFLNFFHTFFYAA